MRYQPIAASFYIQNRKNFANLMQENSIAVFNSNDIMPTNADGVMPFRQNNDLLYFSGVDQEETILLLVPQAKNPMYREVLFVKETNEHIAVWEGEKLTKEKATNLSGVKTVFWLSDFERVFEELVVGSEVIYLNSNEHLRADKTVQTRDDRFRNWCKEKYNTHTYTRIAPLATKLRAIKSEEEIQQLQHACDITDAAFRNVLPIIKPGINEYEIEASLIGDFVRRGSRGFAYAPIIGSGKNACVLHYIENNQICQDGDIILFDVGAEYGNYAADMSRCVPVSGRFSPRQKQVYEAVLRVMRGACKILRPGVLHGEYHKEVGFMMEKELVDLGLLSMEEVRRQDQRNPLYRKYFMHGTSHHLGLDVHDVGDFYRPFESGMVLTCEPGIYIREEGLGIRIENNVVIQSDGVFDLMRNIPIEVEEIEQLMN